jgi:hypothetical protein
MEFSKPYQLTSDYANHFFGYYGISPWSANGRYFICLETDFHDHMPLLGEKARILLIDLENKSQKIVYESAAWNFQQGSMLHWLPTDPNRKIIFNDLDFSKVDVNNQPKPIAKILNIESGEITILPRAINAISKSGKSALCLNFGRLRRNREVISYPTNYNETPGSHPKNDGIWLMDLNTGNSKLIVSFHDIWNFHFETRAITEEIGADGEDADFPEMWIDHVGFNPSETRLFYLARFAPLFGLMTTSMWTCNRDGSDSYLMVSYGEGLSHFEWLNDSEIIVTKKLIDHTSHSHVVLKDKGGEPYIIAPEGLIHDGHPTLSPDGSMLATDCYPIQNQRYVFVVDMQTRPESVYEVACFENIPLKSNSLRCDPHPRWRRDSKQLSFDGFNSQGKRQVYLIDIIK